MSTPSLLSLVTVAVISHLPAIAWAQLDDSRQIQIAAVSYVLNFVRPTEAAPPAVCVSRGRFNSNNPGPMLEGADLDSAIIRAIPNPRFPVLPWSACYIDFEDHQRRKELGTGRQAISIVVGSASFIGKDEAVIDAEYWIHGRNGVSFLCTVVRHGISWEIAACKETGKA